MQDPPVQVHWYNEHTAYLRQNKAYSYEAPLSVTFWLLPSIVTVF